MEVICMNIALNYANVSRSKMNQELLRCTGYISLSLRIRVNLSNSV